MGPYNFPDLRPLFYLALFGIAALALLAIGGIGFVVWFIANHVQIVGL